MVPKVAHVTSIDQDLSSKLLDQMVNIRQAGFDVVGISAAGSDVPQLEAAGIRHLALPMRRTISPLLGLRSLWALYRVFRCERFTIVHTHSLKSAFPAQLAARTARVPIVMRTVHGFRFHENLHPAACRVYIILEKIAARWSDSILSQNKADVTHALDLRICQAGKIKYLGNGIDLKRFDRSRLEEKGLVQKRHEIGLSAGTPVIGFVGRLAGKSKGFLDFLAAGKLVARHYPRVRFLIVGSPDRDRPDAVRPQVAKEYGIWDLCLFMGWRPYSELPTLYGLMDVLVLPSPREGFPRVLMEGAAMQVPCVATDVKGNREAVEHGRNGLLVPYGNPQALADAICELLADPERRRRMGEEGRRIAVERFDEQVVFARIKAEYARLLAEKGWS